ncbi:Dienelactone hydrolase family protein [hydrothermal vent metagenome]|uniref:Dienelactone hydrolase family protein n=1 Tax=hydrothermal vent metagenome TaxID=652676 RepID=A0A3B1BJQ2_9ZZZZ
MFKRLSIVFSLLALLSAPSAVSETMDTMVMPNPKDYQDVMPKTFMGNMVEMSSDKTGRFYLYATGDKTSRAAIVLIHEWWGLNNQIRAVADQFARLGYAVYAVDIYDQRFTTYTRQASEWAQNIDKKRARAILETAITNIRARHKKIGVIGWCFGGGWSLQASLAQPDYVNATVIYYGMLESDPKILGRLKGSVLGIFASKDRWITPEKVDAFEKGLKTAGVKHIIKRYDAQHAFANFTRGKYAKGPARDAWKETVSFFEDNLR